MIIDLRINYLTWALLGVMTIWHVLLLFLFLFLLYDDSLERKKMNLSPQVKESLFYIVAWYALLINTVLLVPFLELAFSNVYCSTDSFAMYECWTALFWIPFGISLFNSLVIAAIALSFSYVGYDLNPFAPNQPFSQPPNKILVLKCLAKMAFPVYMVIDFDNELTKQAVLVILCIFLGQTFIHVEWTPVWDEELQRFFLICDAVLLTVSLAVNAHAFLEFGDPNRNVTLLLLVILYIPSTYGVLAFYKWHKKRHVKFLDVMKKEEDAITWTIEYIHKMLDNVKTKYRNGNEMLISECDKELKKLQMEVLENEIDLDFFEVQFEEKWDERDHSRPFILIYYQIKKILMTHPACPILLLLSAMVLKEKLDNPLKALSQLTLAMHHKPGIEVELGISILKQQIEDALKASVSESEETTKTEIHLFYNYQKQFSVFQFHVMSALSALKDFWIEFLERKPNQEKLIVLSRSIFRAIDSANEAFLDLELMKTDQIKALTIFYRFAKDILNDRILSRRVLDRLEAVKKRNENNLLVSSSGKGKESLVNSALKTGVLLKTTQPGNIFDEKDVAYFTLSGDEKNIGTILDVNKEVKKHLGFKKSDLVQGNIRKIMPWIYGDIHEGLMKDFVSKAETKNINILRNVFPMTKYGFIYPSTLNISIYPSLETGLKFIGFLSQLACPSAETKPIYYILYHEENGYIFGFTENIKNDFGMSLNVVVDRGTSNVDFGIETFFPDINKQAYQTKLCSPFGANLTFTTEPLSAEAQLVEENGIQGNFEESEGETLTLAGGVESDGPMMNSGGSITRKFRKVQVNARIMQADSKESSPVRFISFKISDEPEEKEGEGKSSTLRKETQNFRTLPQQPTMAQSVLVSNQKSEVVEAPRRHSTIIEASEADSSKKREETDSDEGNEGSEESEKVIEEEAALREESSSALASSSSFSEDLRSNEKDYSQPKEEQKNLDLFYENLRTKRIPRVVRLLQVALVIFFIFLFIVPISVFFYKQTQVTDYILNIDSAQNYNERTIYIFQMIFYANKMRALAFYQDQTGNLTSQSLTFKGDQIETENRENLTEISDLFHEAVAVGIKDVNVHGKFSEFLDAKISVEMLLQNGQISTMTELTISEVFYKIQSSVSLLEQASLEEFNTFNKTEVTDTEKELFFLSKNGLGKVLNVSVGTTDDFFEHTGIDIEEARSNLLFLLAGNIIVALLALLFFLPIVSFIYNKNKMIFASLAKADVKEIKQIIKGFNNFYGYLDLDDDLKDELMQSNEGMHFMNSNKNQESNRETPSAAFKNNPKANPRARKPSDKKTPLLGASDVLKANFSGNKYGSKGGLNKLNGEKDSEELPSSNAVHKNMAKVRSLISHDRSEYLKKSANRAKIISYLVFLLFACLFVAHQLYSFFSFDSILSFHKKSMEELYTFLDFKANRALLQAILFERVTSELAKTEDELALLNTTMQSIYQNYEEIFEDYANLLSDYSAMDAFMSDFFEMQYGDVCGLVSKTSFAYPGCSEISSGILELGAVISLSSFVTEIFSLARQLPVSGEPLTADQIMEILEEDSLYRIEAINNRIGIAEEKVVSELEEGAIGKANRDKRSEIYLMVGYLALWAIGFVGMWKKWKGQVVATVRMMQRIIVFVPRSLMKKREEIVRCINKNIIIH